MILLPLLTAWLYAILEGCGQAVVYHHVCNRPPNSKNEHVFYSGQRFILWLLIAIWLLHLGLHSTIFISACFCIGLTFPFFHAGAMYQMRKTMSHGMVYKDGWWSEPSQTGTNKINFSCDIRTGFAIVGFIGYLICAYLQLINR
jgi:uncharacterized membrane protein